MNAPATIIRPDMPGLLTPSAAYKPFRYPWAFDMWKKQQQVHWMPEEVPMGEDVKDWAANLNDGERNLLTQIFRFFTQADVEVNNCYMKHYSQVFKPTEVQMMLSAFSNIETIHISAYSHLLDTLGMPEVEYQAFLKYKAMKDKYDYMQEWGVSTPADVAKTLAVFGAFTEGLEGDEVKAYIRYIADRRLTQIGLQPIYKTDKNPLPWLEEMLNGVEHTNFFENRATEYSRAATQGSWEEAFD